MSQGSQRHSQSGGSEKHQPGDPQFVGRQLGEAPWSQSGCGYSCRRALVDLLPAARDFEIVQPPGISYFMKPLSQQ
jgi:hypothetical protein